MTYHLLTPLTPIEEEMSSRCCGWTDDESSRRVVEKQRSSSDDAKRKPPTRLASSMPNLLFDWTAACCSAPCSHLHTPGADGCWSLSSLCDVDMARQIPWPSWWSDMGAGFP